MPHLDLSPEVSLYYEIVRSNQQNPWLLLLHPVMTDVSWVFSFPKQPEIRDNFNCIFFDYRLHGRTKGPITPTIDYFVFAADIAMAMQTLQIPPVHILACQYTASEVAIRMASIFPEKVLSLFLCGAASDSQTESVQAAYAETFQCLVNPSDVDHWEEGLSLFNTFVSTKMKIIWIVRMIDSWTSLILRRYCPAKAVALTAIGLLELGRETTTQAFNESITQPLMLVHGGESVVVCATNAFDRVKALTKADPRSRHEVISGAPLVLVPTYTPLLSRKFMEWIKPILAEPTMQRPNVIDFQRSLERLASLYNKPSILSRDPYNSSSYYMICDDMLEQRKGMLAWAEGIQKNAITLTGQDAPEWWTDATDEEKQPYVFSQRFR